MGKTICEVPECESALEHFSFPKDPVIANRWVRFVKLKVSFKFQFSVNNILIIFFCHVLDS